MKVFVYHAKSRLGRDNAEARTRESASDTTFFIMFSPCVVINLSLRLVKFILIIQGNDVKHKRHLSIYIDMAK